MSCQLGLWALGRISSRKCRPQPHQHLPFPFIKPYKLCAGTIGLAVLGVREGGDMVQNAMTPQERLAVTPVHSMMAMTKHWIGVDKEWRAEKCRLGQSLRHHVGLRGLAGRNGERGWKLRQTPP